MARHHEAVAWRWRTAQSCWAACFLIELRFALWASPPSITAFVLPAVVAPVSVRGTGAQIWIDTARLRIVLASQIGACQCSHATAKLHKAALPSVPASRCAKASLGAGHRCAPYRVKATRYAKWPSLESVAQPSALPGRIRALRAAVCAPL